MFQARSLAFATGFLSLSLEILWLRLFSFACHSLPQSYAFVIAVCLVGIALGALLGRSLCKMSIDLWAVSGMTLFFASFITYLTPLAFVHSHHLKLHLWIAFFLISINFLLLAIIFPIAHHLGNHDFAHGFARDLAKPSVGKKISRVYAANILGSTLGPLITGVVFLSIFTTQQAFFFIACLIFLLSLFCQIKSLQKISWQTFLFLLFLMVSVQFTLQDNHFIKTLVRAKGEVRRIIENPYGIIVTYPGGIQGDVITGGNVYDGRANYDPLINSNGLERLIVLAALSEEPKHILLIGLSIGSWLKILSGFPSVKSIDVVEINPGYLQAIHDYPALEKSLDDDRVSLFIDDARHFLKVYKKHYDLVVMNTTYSWRMYTGNILSSEFLQIVKNHMHKNSILAYNSTNSMDALKTAMRSFEYSYLYGNFIVAADFDWRQRLKDPKSVQRIAQITVDQKPLIPASHERYIRMILSKPLLALEAVEPLFNALQRPIEIITDDNLITEYKYGRRLSEVNG